MSEKDPWPTFRIPMPDLKCSACGGPLPCLCQTPTEEEQAIWEMLELITP